MIAANLKGLPTTTIINAEIDPLQSDGDVLTDALKRAGVDVAHQLYPGVTHEFFGMGAAVASAKDAEEFGSARLKASLKQ